MTSRALEPRRLRVRRPAALVTVGAAAVAGAVILTLAGGDEATLVSYSAVRQGQVTATAGAAGTVQSADTREVGFGTSGTVTKVYVSAGQHVAEGQTLAKIDKTRAAENVDAAEAALAAAEETEQTARTANSADGGSACTAAAGSSGSAGGSDGVVATPVRLGTTGRTTRSAATSPSPETTGKPRGTATSTPTATATPTTTPTTTPTAAPTSVRPTGSVSPPGGQAPGRQAPGGAGGPCGGAGASADGSADGPADGSADGDSGRAADGRGAGGQDGGRLTEAQAEAQVIQAKVDLDQAERALAGTTLTAPVGGTVLSVAGKVGTVVTGPGSSGFVTIGNLNELQVEADFSQTDVTRLRLGQPAAVTLAGRPGAAYPATVARIDATATDTGSGLVRYRVLLGFDDQPPDLLVGQSATALVTTAEATATLYVPPSAVRRGPGGTYTVQVKDGSGSRTRTVQIGIRGDRYIEIRSGLTTDDQVTAIPSSGASPDSGFPAP